MPIHRHDGTAWTGPIKAIYTLVEADVDHGPPIWVRARTVWRRTSGAWRSATAGAAEAPDLTAGAYTLYKTRGTGTGSPLPGTGTETESYWESGLSVEPGAGCHGYAVWMFETQGITQKWDYLGAFSCAPHSGPRMHVIENGSVEKNVMRWWVTAFGGSAGAQGELPGGQQGYSRFAAG